MCSRGPARPPWLFIPADGAEQIQDGKNLQTPYQHFHHPRQFDEAWQGRIVGHGSYIPETRTDVADASDGGCNAGHEVEPRSDVDGGEDHDNQQIAEDVFVGIVHLCVRPDTPVDTDGFYGIR